MMRSRLFVSTLPLIAMIALIGCDKKTEPPAPSKPSVTPSAAAPVKPDAHDHAAGDAHGDHDHDHDHADGHGDHGPAVALGTLTIGTFEVKASRDGVVTAGGEAPVDVWVTSSAGGKAVAVRAWIGTQDGKGSVKAKLDLEKDHHHGHVEVPKPMPGDARLWIEVENDQGVKTAGSFDLKS